MAKTPVGGKHLTERRLERLIDAYEKAAGNKAAAARLVNLPESTYSDQLRHAAEQFGLELRPIAAGKVDSKEPIVLKKPRGGRVKRYIISSQQNNTHPHPGWKNLAAYARFLEKDGDTCRFMVGTFSYQMAAYGPKAVKKGTYKRGQELWYAPEFRDATCDDVIQLAPGLLYAGNFNELPTAIYPLSKLDRYGGRNSIIIPHAKQHMQSVAALQSEAVKLTYSTGVVTQRNYIQKRAGILAEPEHTYGAVIVEVDSDGNWYVRQLVIGSQGEVYDIGPSWAKGCVLVRDGKVTQSHSTQAVNWGDIHSYELARWVRDLAWGKDGMLDHLRPRFQFADDIHSQHSRNHHDFRRFERNMMKWLRDEESVEDEISLSADVLNEMDRDWLETIVKRSNHHEHIHRWLDETDYREDPANAEFYLRAQLARVEAMKAGDRDFQVLEWALRRLGVSDRVRFLAKEESFVVCKEYDGGVECSLHGHEGVDGARGSTRSYRALGRRTNKGHDHRAYLDQKGPASTGACALNFDYMKGPSTHTISHINTFPNSARQIITCWRGKYRA